MYCCSRVPIKAGTQRRGRALGGTRWWRSPRRTAWTGTRQASSCSARTATWRPEGQRPARTACSITCTGYSGHRTLSARRDVPAASPAMAAALIESLGLMDAPDLMSGLAVPTLCCTGRKTSPAADAAWWPPGSADAQGQLARAEGALARHGPSCRTRSPGSGRQPAGETNPTSGSGRSSCWPEPGRAGGHGGRRPGVPAGRRPRHHAHHPLQRRFRDIHTAGQHISFSGGRDQAYAKVRLGIDQPTFLI